MKLYVKREGVWHLEATAQPLVDVLGSMYRAMGYETKEIK